MNNVELPGVVYDLNNSTNNQFNLNYIVQEDPQGSQGPRVPVVVPADRLQRRCPAILEAGIAVLPVLHAREHPRGRRVNTTGLGSPTRWARASADLRRSRHRPVDDRRRLAALQAVLPRGESECGRRDHLRRRRRLRHSPFAHGRLRPPDRPVRARGRTPVSFNVGGRLDYCDTWLNRNDPVIMQFADPSEWYYEPGFNEPNCWLGMAYFTHETRS